MRSLLVSMILAALACTLSLAAVEVGQESYERVVAESAEYSQPIMDPFQWASDNIQRKKNSAIASAWLSAIQRDLDGDKIDELMISSKELAGNGETTYLVFKISSDQMYYYYIGCLSILGGRIGVYADPDGSMSVVTGGQSAGIFYVLYYRNNGKSFSTKAREEYEIDSERIIGLPRRITDIFPELKQP